MLQIVRIALSKPYTFVVMAILIVLFGVSAWVRTPTDIFPDIRMPVIAVVWSYNGLPPEDMSGRVIYFYERQLANSVNDIDHVESQSLNGVGVVKIFFRPNVDIRTATAQVTSISQTVLKQMPPGMTPPQILNYNASTVPILQLALSSHTLGEQKILDLGQNFIRPALATVEGAAVPTPYGGRVRQIQVDLNPAALQAHHLSPQDVATALAAQNQIVPPGTAKIGTFEYNVRLNNSPSVIDDLNALPIHTVDGTTVTMRDIGYIHDGAPPQTNEVRVDGRRAVLMTILKAGSTSTVAIVDDVKAMLPRLALTLPPELHIQALADQSLFVKAAVSGVIREGVIAALLTSLMILLFLGSWRSTVIIATSIPLAVLAAVAGLSATGETLNIMTLGGLSLAVGILVDDATVTIENINWHLEHGKAVRDAILDGAAQIVGPALVSLLCVCIAFVPMFFLPGVAGFLFAPMAKAVVFAMIASFVLSRTLVPTMGNFLLRDHAGSHTAEVMSCHDAVSGRPGTHNPLRRFQHGFERRFEGFRGWYMQALAYALARRRLFVPGFLGVVVLSFALVPLLGRNFFPTVDSGQVSLHVRAPVGTRLEDTAALFDHVENRIRDVIPPGEITSIVDNIGLPVSGINRAYSNTGGIGPQDGDILVTLKEGHRPTAGYVKMLRAVLPRAFPGSDFSFLPADIVSQILNFGAPAPIDVMVTGPDSKADSTYAQELATRMRGIAGIADVRLQQAEDYPELAFDINRAEADRLGITENDVTRSLSVDLSGSFQVAPTFWLNPKNGVSYPIVVQAPQYRADSISALDNTPITSGDAGIADVRLQQAEDYPELAFDINRAEADRLGITENDVTRSLSVDLAGSFQVAPTFWLNPKNGVSYPIVVQAPQYRADSISALDNTPITSGDAGTGNSGGNGPGSDGIGSGTDSSRVGYQILGGLGTLHRQPSAAVVSHYAVQPAFDVYATTQGRDLGSVAGDLDRLLVATRHDLPKGAAVNLRGQVQTMNTAFTGLLTGLAMAVVLIYLLLVVNFQSWADPAVIVSALPAALAGIVWMLFSTGTTLSVPALTGAIMCMGVATANSVLVVSFARERLAACGNAAQAALEAGATRFRPVLMTALAMIIGMAPMALGLGEGGEQNAPLGRAVIGGLIFATIATLVFVPVVFSIVHRRHGEARPADATPAGELSHA